jgi:hypothetical protein
MINRRTMLAALPASTFALAPAASSTPTDPILEHYREWLAARAEWKRVSYLPGNENFDLPESIEADKREDAALSALLEHTPVTLEGMAALVHVLWYLDDPVIGDPDLESHVAKATLGLWRATTGRSDIPGMG